MIKSTWEKVPAAVRSQWRPALSVASIGLLTGLSSRYLMSGMTSADQATLLSGFGGALVGGGISWILAHQSAVDAQSRDRQARLDAEKAAAFRFSIKLVTIANGIHTTLGHIERAIEHAEARKMLHHADNTPRELWQIVKATPTTSHLPVTFEASEIEHLMTHDRIDLINKSLAIADQFNALHEGYASYNVLRREMNDTLSPYMSFDAEFGISTAGAEASQDHNVQAKAFELETLLGEVIDLGTEYRNSADSLCAEVGVALRSIYGPDFPSVGQAADSQAGTS